MIWIAAGSIALLVFGIVLHFRARQSRAELDLPGEILYSDADAMGDVLVSEKHGLVGKPDYIISRAGELIPVERKSRLITSSRPYDGEILQLAAYCILVEESFGVTVKRGQLRYPNRSIEIAFDATLRTKLLMSIRAIQEASVAKDVPRCHDSATRCQRCGFAQVCSDSLV